MADQENYDEPTTDIEMVDAEEKDSGFGSGNSSPFTSNEAIADDCRPAVPEIDEEAAEMILDFALEDNVELTIDRDGGSAISFDMKKTATINDVINRAMGDLSNAEYDLHIDGKSVSRQITLRDAVINPGNRLRLVERKSQVFIRNVDGRNHTFDFRPSTTTVLDLKKDFSNRHMVPVNEQHLQFQGKELENNRLLKSYGIKKDSQIQTMHRLRGG